jgi:hypothetical protein
MGRSAASGPADCSAASSAPAPKTVGLTIPVGAKVIDNRATATLADVKAGQRVVVIQAPKVAAVLARDTP